MKQSLTIVACLGLFSLLVSGCTSGTDKMSAEDEQKLKNAMKGQDFNPNVLTPEQKAGYEKYKQGGTATAPSAPSAPSGTGGQ